MFVDQSVNVKGEKIRRAEGKVVENFECQNCGSKKYKVKTKIDEIYMASVDHYECEGCSMLFGDPEKFSKAKAIAKKRELAEMKKNIGKYMALSENQRK